MGQTTKTTTKFVLQSSTLFCVHEHYEKVKIINSYMLNNSDLDLVQPPYLRNDLSTSQHCQ